MVKAKTKIYQVKRIMVGLSDNHIDRIHGLTGKKYGVEDNMIVIQ